MKRLFVIEALLMLLAVAILPLNTKAGNNDILNKDPFVTADSSHVNMRGKRAKAFRAHSGWNTKGRQMHQRKMMDFSDKQKEQMKTIKLKSMERSKVYSDELRELAARQQTLVTADSPNRDAIYKNLEKMSGLKLEIAKIKADTNQEIRAILTKEQLIKFDQRGKGRSWGGRSSFKDPIWLK